MFIGREKELALLKKEYSKESKSAILVYGKRRIGKSTLIKQSLSFFDGTVISHVCVEGQYYETALQELSYSITSSLNLPEMNFKSIVDIFSFLASRTEKILLFIDEYQFLKETKPNNVIDSFMQIAIDSLSDNIKVILCGSYISVMKELLEHENPLFGRFSTIIHLKEFDYFDSGKFFPHLEVREKLELYSVFGGSPFVLSLLNENLSLEDNIKTYLLPENSVLQTYIESVMFKELKKSFDIGILLALKNSKKRYSEIASVLDSKSVASLDKQLGKLVDAEIVEKIAPINKKNDKKKSFYKIKNNLIMFYYTYICSNKGRINLIGESTFFDNTINPSINTFISYRFEDIAKEFISREIKKGNYPNSLDLGSYWYDDKEKEKNGEFDCVLKETNGYTFFECKFYNRPLTLNECKREEQQVRESPLNEINKIGFISLNGFDFSSKKYILVSGEGMFKE